MAYFELHLYDKEGMRQRLLSDNELDKFLTMIGSSNQEHIRIVIQTCLCTRKTAERYLMINHGNPIDAILGFRKYQYRLSESIIGL